MWYITQYHTLCATTQRDSLIHVVSFIFGLQLITFLSWFLYKYCFSQDENNPLRLEQFRTSDAFLYVFSVTDRASLDYLKSHALNCPSGKRDGERAPILLIGNKKDLCHLREVSTTEGETFAKEIGATYMELSASENFHCVEDAFHSLYREYNRAEKREKVKRISARLQLRQTIKNFTDKHLYHRNRTHTLWFQSSARSETYYYFPPLQNLPRKVGHNKR